MKLYYLLLLSVAITRGLGNCSRNDTSSAVVQWKCGAGELNHTNCISLNDALNFIQQKAADCSGQKLIAEIYLNSNVTLSNSTHIEGIARFSLFGSKNLTVVCVKGAALKFVGKTFTSMTIEIQSLSFQKCGNGRAALALSGNCDITFDHLKVVNSNGSGLLLENITGIVNVRHSSFENNSLQRGVGAGVHINISSTQSPFTTIRFVYCNFVGNQAPNDSKDNLDNLDIGGGGMCILFAGKNVSINIYNCWFRYNNAQNGAGLFASYMGEASNNSLVINMTHFVSNKYTKCDNKVDLYNSGGGAMVVSAESSTNNNLLFQSCTFSGNSATWGGALELFSVPLQPYELDWLNHFHIVNSTFKENRGTVGSAINIHCESAASSPQLCNTLPLIEGDSFFVDNGYKHRTYSTLNINSFPTNISGKFSFRGNFGSPLLIHKTVVGILERSLLTFDNNSAQTGGAISLYDSWMTVSNGSQLFFNNNTACTAGGAIYAHQSKQLYVPYAHNCFIRYLSATTEPPWGWDSAFEFSGNRAGNKTSSIYATSIIPCVWKYPNSTSPTDDLKVTFCKWTNWTFHGPDCNDQILTSVRNFSATPDSVQLSPGIPKQFIVGVDDLGHRLKGLSIIPTLLSPPQGKNYNVSYIDEGLVVSGQRSNLTVRIEFDGDRTVYKTVNIAIGDCPPGFAFSPESLSCKCFENKRQFMQCHGRSWKASIRNGFCMTYSKINHINQTVYGRCVFTTLPRSQGQSHYIPLPEDEKVLDEKLCRLYNRTGLLCGRCIDNFSIDFFSTTFKCYDNTICFSSAAKSWTIYLAVTGLPPLAMFMAILLLHISLTGGTTNGFIFFSQVVTLSQEVFVLLSTSEGTSLHGAHELTSYLLDFYNIWSLDFYRIYHSFTRQHPLCLSEKLKVIDVLALHYLSALYPFILIAMAYVIIELHARNCRIFVCLWKPLCLVCTRFRLSLKAQTSVVDAFATFIILSYVRIVRISLLLISFTSVRTLENDSLVKRVNNYDPTIIFMSKEHMPYILSGTFFLLTFGLLPPILLLFYQFKVVQRCLDRCKMNRLGLKTFMDSFQGCYKDGRNGGPDRRFFAGLYLVFRVVIFMIFNLQIPFIIVYYCLVVVFIFIAMLIAFLQPYKTRFFNHLDIFFTCLLACFFGLHIVGFSYLESTLQVPIEFLVIAYFVGNIPLIYLTGLVMMKVLRRVYHSQAFRCRVRLPHIILNICQERQLASTERDPQPNQFVTYSEVSIKDDDIPDRLVNPCLYNNSATSKEYTHRKDNTNTRESGYGSIN